MQVRREGTRATGFRKAKCLKMTHSSCKLQSNPKPVLAIGRYAQDYHFARLGRPLPKGARVDEIVRSPPEFSGESPKIIALPHPSWRNSGWLKQNPWFETEVLPELRESVAKLIG